MKRRRHDAGSDAGGTAHPARTVAARGVGRFAGDVLLRFRSADGTTHVRALAYQTMFVAISGFIGLIGLASVLDIEQLRGVAQQMARSFAPGESGRLLQETIRQGSSEGATAAIVGLVAATIAGTLALAQLERSANRLAGSNEDRPGVGRYLVAARLALTAGVLLVAGTLVAIGGGAVARGFGWTGTVETTWAIARWPIGAALVLLATYLLFLGVPRARIGARREVFGGALASLALWVAFSAALALYFAIRADAGENPYGPLLAVVALLLWSMLSSLAFHLGMATVCDLAGAPRPGAGDVVRLPDMHAEADASPAVPSPS